MSKKCLTHEGISYQIYLVLLGDIVNKTYWTTYHPSTSGY
jgi:hypothetical protein